jgi:hypothetical protein
MLVECNGFCSIICALSWDNIVSYILYGISAHLFIFLIWKVECSNSIFSGVSELLHETLQWPYHKPRLNPLQFIINPYSTLCNQ